MNPNEVVYISNIPKQTSLGELHSLLKSSGNVVGSTFMRENRNDCRTKIAFVLFENEDQAAEACNLDQTLFQSHRLSVMMSNDDRKFLAGYTIVIHNTSSDTSEEDLFEACCRYGNVETVQIPTNHYAFVGFSERSAAHAAHRKLDNSMLNQHQVSVKVLDEDVRVRLEDLDSYKTPRVYNELLRAKQQYFSNHQPSHNDMQQNMMDQDDDFQDQQYNVVDVDDDPLGQFNQNDSCDDFVPQQDQQAYEEEYSPLFVYRRDVRFGKLRFQTENKTAVKVENIPREVYDEDVVIYFQKFGPILSIEKGICLNALFSKVYMINYLDEESQQRAINCFCRQVVLSDINCTLFTMIPGEALHPIKNQSVLINYVPNFILYDEIVQAFSDIGNVLYVEKKVRNNGPTIVHFSHQINMNDACQIDDIAGIVVAIVPVSQKDFIKFASSLPVFQRAVKGKLTGTPKGKYLQEIEAKEEQEKKDNIIFKTGFDPHYRNPNPKKYSFEVVLYNCPKSTKFGQLKSYFNRAGAVLAMRREPSKFDPNTWKVFVSFANYLQAYRAIRLKGRFGLDKDLIFKHIAAESPRLDCVEAVMVTIDSEENLSVAQVARGFVRCGGLYFAEKTAPNEFIIIFRDMKGAQRACEITTVERLPADVFWMKDTLKQKGRKKIVGLNMSANTGVDDDSKDHRPRVLLSEMFARKETKEKKPPAAQQIAPPATEKQEPLIVEIINKPCESPKASTSSAPPPDIKGEDLRNIIAEKRIIKSECQDQLNNLEEMERLIKQKEQDIQRRLQQLEKDEANVTALLPTTSTKRIKLSEEKAKEPTSSKSEQSSKGSGSGSSQRISPIRAEASSSSQRISTHTTTIANIPTYPGDNRTISDQMRSVSPSDRLAHERYMQIRVEKIAITQELDSLRQRFDYRKGSRVDALRDLLAGLNREQREIQIQLEAKRRFRMPDDVNYAGSSFDASPSPPPRRYSNRSLSRSRSPYRSPSRSRSRSRTPGRYVHSRTRSRSRSRRSRHLTRSRTRSPLRFARVSRSPSPQSSRHKRRRTRTPSRETNSSSVRRGYSLERDMYHIGRYHTGHLKHSVYVGNISCKVTEREIEEIFARFGRLADVDFSRYKRHGEAYFDYTNREHAFKALEMNNVKISGRRLRVAFNIDKPSNREGYTVYFTVRQPTDEQTIYRSFASYGEIDFIWYPENELFGTVSFRRTEDATDALAVNKLIDGTPIKSRPFIDKVNAVQ
uniref:RRM domain-containing protein n=1 Tax=Anopheles funestus TaxID=62324 RepID=A0A182R5Z6_ANOFN